MPELKLQNLALADHALGRLLEGRSLMILCEQEYRMTEQCRVRNEGGGKSLRRSKSSIKRRKNKVHARQKESNETGRNPDKYDIHILQVAF